MSDLIDALVTWIERHVNWKPLWASRLLGCTFGLLRIVGWRMDGPYASWGLSWAMWQARYWYDWGTTR